MRIFLILLLFVITTLFVGFIPALLTLVVGLLGIYMSGLLERKHKIEVKSIYNNVFVIGWLWMLLCYLYMRDHGFDYLFSFDSVNAYIPTTQHYMAEGNYHYMSILSAIFGDFNIFYRNEYFYTAYTCFWGLVSIWLNIDLYYVLQLSTLFVYGFVGVVLYKLIRLLGIDSTKSDKYTYIICTCSIVFFYSSQILRDTFVLLCYVYAIYLSLQKELKAQTIIKLTLVIILCMGLRVESGLYLLLCIPIYVLSLFSLKDFYKSFLFTIVVIATAVLFFMLNQMDITNIVEHTDEAYLGDKGSGIVGTLHGVPVIGDYIALHYNALLPMPFWSRMIVPRHSIYGAEVYNIMNFPRAFASFFNLITMVYLYYCLFSKSVRLRLRDSLSRAMKYQILIGIVFLYIQASVISQRRLMGYYCVFYVLFFLIYTHTPISSRKVLNTVTIFLFAALQLITYLVL